MLYEAQDLNSFYSFADNRMLGRAGSFCLQRSGFSHPAGGRTFNQGLAWFLPNMTFYQPAAYVHAINSKTMLHRAVVWTPLPESGHAEGSGGGRDGGGGGGANGKGRKVVDGRRAAYTEEAGDNGDGSAVHEQLSACPVPDPAKPSPTLSVATQAFANGSTVVVRVVNSGTVPTSFSIADVIAETQGQENDIAATAAAAIQAQQNGQQRAPLQRPRQQRRSPFECKSIEVWELAGGAAGLQGMNTPSQPTRIAPTTWTLPCSPRGSGGGHGGHAVASDLLTFPLAPLSFTVFKITA